MKSFKNKFVACALAFTLVGGAFAINPNVAEAAGKPLNIKKVLNLPAEGVTTPTETFTFKFTAHSKNGDEAKKDDVPKVDDITIAYTADDDKDNDTKVDGKQLIKESADALANVNWTASGQYTYTVTETTGNNDEMTYSKASYKVSVFVGKTEDGTGFEVTNIQIVKLTDDKGDPATDSKQEYEPGDETDPTKDKNKFAFENYYNKKDGNDKPGGGTEITDDDKKGFAFKKIVADEGTDSFKFTFKVEKPAGSKSTDTGFDYYIVKNDGKAGEKQTGEYGSDIIVNLKHNERVVLGKTLLGSTVTVEETDAGVYTGSVKESMFNGTKGQTNTGIIGDQDSGNYVEYENTKQTATGLLVDNLPFIALVAVAGAGIAFFVKNREEEEALA